MNKGFAEWKRFYRRLRNMKGAEFADRLRQQAIARLDFLRYKAGVSFEPSALGDAPPSPPSFFFSSTDVPLLCAALRERFPAETDDIIERAERICKHRFDLLGYRDIDYGKKSIGTAFAYTESGRHES